MQDIIKAIANLNKIQPSNRKPSYKDFKPEPMKEEEDNHDNISMTWEQKYANKEGFTGMIPLVRWVENCTLDPEKQRKKEYYKIVWEYTEQNAPNVPNIELRGKDYHLDHIMPIAYGFKNDIDPAIIGALDNLQILTHRDNFLKAAKYKPETKE